MTEQDTSMRSGFCSAVSSIDYRSAIETAYVSQLSNGKKLDDKLKERGKKLEPIVESVSSELEELAQALISAPKEKFANELCHTIINSASLLDKKAPNLDINERSIVHNTVIYGIVRYAIVNYAMTELGLNKEDVIQLKETYKAAYDLNEELRHTRGITNKEVFLTEKTKKAEQMLNSSAFRTFTEFGRTMRGYITEMYEVSSEDAMQDYKNLIRDRGGNAVSMLHCLRIEEDLTEACRRIKDWYDIK